MFFHLLQKEFQCHEIPVNIERYHSDLHFSNTNDQDTMDDDSDGVLCFECEHMPANSPIGYLCDTCFSYKEVEFEEAAAREREEELLHWPSQ